MATKINNNIAELPIILPNNNDILKYITLEELLHSIVSNGRESQSKIIIYIIVGLYYSGITFISQLTNKVLTTNINENTVFVPNATIELNNTVSESKNNKSYKYNIISTDHKIKYDIDDFTINTKIANVENIILTFNDESIHVIKQAIDELIDNTIIRCKYLFVFRNATDIVHIRTQKTLNILKTIDKKINIKEENIKMELNKLKKLHDKIKKNAIYYLYTKTSMTLNIVHPSMYNMDDKTYDNLLKTIITNDIIQKYRDNIIHYTLFSSTKNNNITKNNMNNQLTKPNIEKHNINSFDFSHFVNTIFINENLKMTLNNFLRTDIAILDKNIYNNGMRTNIALLNKNISNTIDEVLLDINYILNLSKIEQCKLNKKVNLNKMSDYLQYNNIKNMNTFKSAFKAPKKPWYKKATDKFTSLFTTRHNNLRASNNVLQRIIHKSKTNK